MGKTSPNKPLKYLQTSSLLAIALLLGPALFPLRPFLHASLSGICQDCNKAFILGGWQPRLRGCIIAGHSVHLNVCLQLRTDCIALTFSPFMQADASSVLCTSSGHVLVAFWSFSNVHELARTQAGGNYSLVRTHALPAKIEFMTIANWVGSERVLITHHGTQTVINSTTPH